MATARTCEVCGRSFVPKDGRASKRHCGSDECFAEHRRRANAARMARKRAAEAESRPPRRSRAHLSEVPPLPDDADDAAVDKRFLEIVRDVTPEAITEEAARRLDLVNEAADMVVLIVQTARARARWFDSKDFHVGTVAWANVAHAYAATGDDASAALRKQAVDAAVRAEQDFRAIEGAASSPAKLLEAFALGIDNGDDDEYDAPPAALGDLGEDDTEAPA